MPHMVTFDAYSHVGNAQIKNALHTDYNPEGADKEVGWWTVDGADFRGIQQDA